jgi:prepilin-type N-terminal cleavage/methylation domain-containing protein
MRPVTRNGIAANAGFSLIELIIAMAITTLITGVTLAGLADVAKGNEVVMTIAAMNSSLRTGTDLMIRDLLQAASGLPASHVVTVPNGTGSQRIRLPGPPGSNFQLANQPFMEAVIPMDGAGPVIDGVATDVLATLMADNAFIDVALSAVGNTQVTVAAGPDITNGPDRVVDGQLMLISKGSANTLVQVTSVDYGNRILRFQDNDSLRLNQTAAASGNLAWLNAQAPANNAASTRISRVRLITYYLDTTSDPAHPRLVRRVNNGDDTTFDNNLGTAVASDVINLQFTYDIVNGVNNPGGVSMSAADRNGTGACAPNPCDETQIRKVGLRVTARAPNRVSGAASFMTNTLESQVSLRAMAFVDRFR